MILNANFENRFPDIVNKFSLLRSIPRQSAIEQDKPRWIAMSGKQNQQTTLKTKEKSLFHCIKTTETKTFSKS